MSERVTLARMSHDPVGQRILDRLKVEGECWLYQGWCDGKGYRKIRVKGRTEYVHRWVWEFVTGRPLGRRQVHHKCLNRSCWRPDHIEATTGLQNMREMNNRRWNRR